MNITDTTNIVPYCKNYEERQSSKRKDRVASK